MECRHCHTVWSGENLRTPECCPVCGGRMDDVQTPKKESFHAVWGNLEKEAFQKNPSQKQFDAAAAHYLQAAVENPEESILLADFARVNEAYARQSQPLASLLQAECLQSEIEDFSGRLEERLSEAAAKKGQAWALAFLWKKLREAKAGQKTGQASRLAGQLETLCTSLKNQKLTPMAKSVLAAFSGQYDLAVPALLQALTRGEKGRLEMDDLIMRELYTGLRAEAENRMEDLAAAMQAEDDRAFFEELVRPLDHSENAFAHLDHPDPRWAQYLETHWNSMLPLFESHIESRTALRGMHLLLNWLQNNAPHLKEDCAKLLDAHFVQVYMRDYEEISATDWAWQSVPAKTESGN